MYRAKPWGSNDPLPQHEVIPNVGLDVLVFQTGHEPILRGCRHTRHMHGIDTLRQGLAIRDLPRRVAGHQGVVDPEADGAIRFYLDLPGGDLIELGQDRGDRRMSAIQG